MRTMRRRFLKGLFWLALGVVLPIRVPALRMRRGWVLREDD